MALASLIGWLSLTARRLQDRGNSGWWQLANYTPIIIMYIFLIPLILNPENIGLIIGAGLFGLIAIGTGITLIVFLCLPPIEDENKWGRNPLLPETSLPETSLTDQMPD